MLTADGCKQRLARVREEFASQEIDLGVLSNYRSVYYASGHLREVELPQFLVVETHGKTTLITDTHPRQSVADENFLYEAYSLDWSVSFRGISEKAVAVLKQVLSHSAPAIRQVGLEKDRISGLAQEAISGCFPSARHVDVGAILAHLRRCKYPDEIHLITECVAAIEAGYAAARSAIHPGATELDVFKEIHGEIVKRAGYNLKFEADFACGTRGIKEGGTPLRHAILPGDLYILDIFPSFHGYYADLCRTFAVSQPTDLQMRAWEVARNALSLAEEIIRPGVPAREVWKRLRDYVDSFDFVAGSFWHHAGHGLGLDSQEPPWLTPGSDHRFAVGDVVAVEPGCYSEALQGGVRLERNYVIRRDGVENLSHFPLDL